MDNTNSRVEKQLKQKLLLSLPCWINCRRYDIGDPRCECEQSGRNEIEENVLKN